AQLVEPLAARRATGLDAAQAGVVGVVRVVTGGLAAAQVGRPLRFVVDAADDERLVGVPLQEGDDHLLPDPRPEAGAPALARPDLRHPAPARVLADPGAGIPVEVHLHPPVAVGEDLLPGCARAGHDGRLGPRDDRTGGQAWRPEGQPGRDAGERVLV